MGIQGVPDAQLKSYLFNETQASKPALAEVQVPDMVLEPVLEHLRVSSGVSPSLVLSCAEIPTDTALSLHLNRP